MRGNKVINAVENPWYILATLFGEQEGQVFDRNLHAKNRKAWNAWATQGYTDAEKENLIQKYRIFEGEIEDWSSFENDVVARLDGHSMRGRENSSSLNSLNGSIPKPDELINFSKVEFRRMLCLDKFYFPNEVDFNDCAFMCEVEAGWMVCAESAAFNGAKFHKIADFSDAKFLNGCYFSKSSFKSEAYWEGVDFHESASFIHSIFESRTNFQNSRFFKSASFEGARLRGDAWFYGARFNEGVSFWQADFVGRLTMTEAVFEGGDRFRRSEFSDAVFHLPANFRSATFKDTYPDFSGAILHEQTIFSANEKLWPKHVQKHVEEAKETCAVLRHLTERQGLIENAHFFFRREMRFASQLGSPLQRFPYIAYGLLSDFGYSIARPAIGLIAVFFLGLVFLWGGFFLEESEYPLRSAMALSLNNVFPFFGFGRSYLGSSFMENLHTVKKIISGIQSILSLPLMFFLGLGLRTRFRMR